MGALGGTRPRWRVADNNALAPLLYQRATEVAFHLAHFGQHLLKTVRYFQKSVTPKQKPPQPFDWPQANPLTLHSPSPVSPSDFDNLLPARSAERDAVPTYHSPATAPRFPIVSKCSARPSGDPRRG